MDFSEGFCTEKFLHPQNSQRGVQAEDPEENGKKKKKRKATCRDVHQPNFFQEKENKNFIENFAHFEQKKN